MQKTIKNIHLKVSIKKTGAFSTN